MINLMLMLILDYVKDPDKSSQLCQDFPSFYTRSLEASKPVINGDILPNIHLPGKQIVYYTLITQ